MGSFFFFVVSWYVVSDKGKAERQIACNADMVVGGEEGEHARAYREGADSGEGAQPILRNRLVDT